MNFIVTDADQNLPLKVYELLNKLNLQNLLRKHDSVTIKPNLCCLKPPQSGATTDVQIVKSIVDCIRSLDQNMPIRIVESPSLTSSVNSRFARLGYTHVQAQLVDLSREKCRSISGISLPEILFGTLFISVAKLKTHYFTDMSCILKNQFGCIPDKRKYKYHPYIGETLALLNDLIRPELCIVDALYAMEGMGPINGQPKKLNMLIGGNDPIETDRLAWEQIMITSMSMPPPTLRRLLKFNHRCARSLPLVPWYIIEEMLINTWRVFR